MPQLLLELFSEEIPARMQAGAARDLERLATERFAAAGFSWSTLQTFAGPRRLVLVIDELPASTPDRSEELKGPKASAPPQALEGFLRKTGLARAQLTERDGVFYATLAHAGRPTPQIAAEIVGEIMRAFPWPKSMRSGVSSFRWVRPLKQVLFLFDGAVVPFEINGLTAGDVTEGHRFMGSRGAPLRVRDAQDYKTRLNAEFVALEAAQRRQTILDRGHAACAAQGLEMVEDEGLLDEVAGLAEWPTPLIGDMDSAFLDLPPEVIRTSMRTHQKYFAVRPAGAGERNETGLAPHFLVVANIEATDGGEEIRRGNAKVLSARLSDARFFWDEDRKPGAFERWNEKLKGVTFHAKLGTMAERVERIAALAREIAPAVGADPDLAERAARLAKADLASAMVGEFPELQGVMGGYYVRQAPYADHASAAELLKAAEPDGQEDPLSSLDTARHSRAHPNFKPEVFGPDDVFATAVNFSELPNTELARKMPGSGARWWDGLSRLAIDEIADSVRDHYKPVGPSDSAPRAPISVAIALAEKLQTLVDFFAIDERPTGSKDPFALRRAALGVIRIILENRLRLPLVRALTEGAPHVQIAERYFRGFDDAIAGAFVQVLEVALRIGDVDGAKRVLDRIGGYDKPSFDAGSESTIRFVQAEIGGGQEGTFTGNFAREIVAFFADRLKVLLRDEGKRHDLVDAVFALGDDDLVRIVDRVEALSAFLATEDGANLLAGYKRAVNILRAEQKKHPQEAYEGALDAALFSAPEEQALAATLGEVRAAMEPLLAAEAFSGAMGQLAKLRGPVDAFFERVLVNDPDAAVRMNRLRLLATIQGTANQVADFSLIQG